VLEGRKKTRMKKVLALVMTLLCGGAAIVAAHDNDSVVSWSNIVGVITAPGIDNPVASVTDDQGNLLFQIHSGTLPWVTRSGSARVDLLTGAVQFSVRGLVFIGGNASGTAGGVDQIEGTLVCNPGSADLDLPQAVLDTPPVALSANGNADFSGELTEPVPGQCGSPLFLIRLGPEFGLFAGRWLAAGVEPRLGDSNGHKGGHERHDN
jgi:hypothetical protein